MMVQSNQSITWLWILKEKNIWKMVIICFLFFDCSPKVHILRDSSTMKSSRCNCTCRFCAVWQILDYFCIPNLTPKSSPSTDFSHPSEKCYGLEESKRLVAKPIFKSYGQSNILEAPEGRILV